MLKYTLQNTRKHKEEFHKSAHSMNNMKDVTVSNLAQVNFLTRDFVTNTTSCAIIINYTQYFYLS